MNGLNAPTASVSAAQLRGPGQQTAMMGTSGSLENILARLMQINARLSDALERASGPDTSKDSTTQCARQVHPGQLGRITSLVEDLNTALDINAGLVSRLEALV